MRVRIFSTSERAARAVAQRITAALQAQPSLVLGVAAGRTPVPIYAALVGEFEAGRADFSRVTTFSLDEFLGVPQNHPKSFHAFLHDHLFSQINIPRSAIHTLNGAARNPAEECARYERSLRRAGGIDLQILGLGANGHIAFNEPGTFLHAWTHQARLRADSRRATAEFFDGRIAEVPRNALTMGMGTIMSARKIVLLATGRAKASAVAYMLSGRCTTEVPASLLQLHPNVEVFLDQKAATKIARSYPTFSSSLRRGSRSSPIASRTES